MKKTNEEKIRQVLTRGVEEVIVKEDLEKKLRSGKKLRIKLGVDPTSPNLHVGRSVVLLKLRDFQELGHKIVLIIGDFTGVIGDTSDKDSERPMLEEKIVEQNMKDYIAQAGKVIDLKKCETRFNSEWLEKLTYTEIGAQADLFSVAEFITRDNIKRRLDNGKRVSAREMLYPLMQGYDSVAIRADVEIGGTDQRFNLLAGRKMQPFYQQVPQNIMTLPLLEGTDGRKMSSSWGNTINLTEEPNEMFGKIMSIKDGLIIKYFDLVTRLPLTEIKKFEKEIRAGGNPRDYKMKLAYELVKFYHSEREAKKAQVYFINTFSKKIVPPKSVTIKANTLILYAALSKAKIITSKNELTRLVKQGGIKLNNKKISDSNIKVKKGDLIQKGKRFFVKIV